VWRKCGVSPSANGRLNMLNLRCSLQLLRCGRYQILQNGESGGGYCELVLIDWPRVSARACRKADGIEY
jgi:hypothetical protein